MAMGRWWKRQRLDLDDDDFKAEVETHLAMAEAERVAEGADREAAHFAALKDFGNVTLTTEAARRVWTPGWLEAVRDLTSDLRYAVRSLLQHKGFAADRCRRARARHRRERRRLHHAQEHRAHPARWRGPVGQPPRHPRRDQHGARPPRVVSRLRPAARARPGVFRALRVGPGHHHARARARRPPGVGRTGHRELLPRARRRRPARPRPAGVRRGGAGPAIRSSSSATVCGAPTSAPIPTSSARPS